MIWVDREVKQLKERNLPLEWVDDMKTPSGKIHVGALRGVVIHDVIYKVLIENNINTKFTYIFDDHDPMDAIPSYLEHSKWEKYAGMQLYSIPSPEPGYDNYAQYYAQDFIKVFESINCYPEIIWGSELYNSGKMNGVIKEVLDNVDEVRTIYKEIYKKDKPTDWFPFNVVCEKCKKVGTNQVYAWDGQIVSYRCVPQMVSWAEGCGHEGTISPFNGNGKLPWKLDWPAKWKVLGITVEGAGKDHMSAGGSHDVAKEFCKRIFHYPSPYPLPYEWFTIGGRKMSTSKGVGVTAEDVSKILPSEVFRFLIVRTPINTALDFNPYGDTILNLFDDYDRCFTAYFDKLEGKIPEGKPGEVLEDFARIFELSQVKELSQTRLFLPRFRTVVSLVKTQADILQLVETQKGSPLTSEEKTILEERVVYAQVYLTTYAESDERLTFVENIPDSFAPTDSQRKFLKELTTNLENTQSTDREKIQEVVFTTLKSGDYKPKEVFAAFYKVLTGRDFGPKAADIILQFGTQKVIERLKIAVSYNAKTENKNFLYPLLNDPKIFSIDPQLAAEIPSIIIGVAIIRGATVEKINEQLKMEINAFLETQVALTNEVISSYPEMQSYRRLYKEMGIDWHSRRPSPEALLRRIALKKGLYEVNTCVDVSNLVVMKTKVSCGVFDLDTIRFPTVLRYGQEGEEILLLGDHEPTKYRKGEIAYFDQKGGYNIDFNYRDSQKTAVTEKTKNIFINIDGVYEISRQQVEQTLKETIDLIIKYCGGTVSNAGIVVAE